MELKVYSHNGTLKLTVSPSSSSTVTEEVMGENSVSVTFILFSYVLLEVNDYVLVDSVKYKIRTQYRPVKEHSSKYVYQVKFWAPIHDAQDALMLFTADNDIRTEFAFDGSPREHLQMWVDNMNRRAGKNLWSVGSVLAADPKTIEYRNMNCWNAAFGGNGIAQAFETEMWADGYVINLCRCSRGESVSLGYLSGLTRLVPVANDIDFFTRLYPLGSSRNIDAHKYGEARLQLPSRNKFVDRDVDKFGVIEKWEEQAFSHIYPRYTGTVSAVRTEKKTSEEGRDYIVYYIKDEDIGFNPNEYELPELTKHIAFQTGDLAGRGDDQGSFEANWIPASKEWEIINVYPDETTQLPGGNIIPQIGDKYIPSNFSLPEEYTTAAEAEYKAAVDDFLLHTSFEPVKYEGTTDRNYIEKNAIQLYLGRNIKLLSSEYFPEGFTNSRVVKVVRKLNDLSQINIVCADKVGSGWKNSVDNKLTDLKYQMAAASEQAFDIIRTTDSKTPSDNNIFSALKALNTFLRKDKPDQTNYFITFLRGLLIGGNGSGITVLPDGTSQAVVDRLYVKLKAHFEELEVQRKTYVGGSQILTPSGMKCIKVEDRADSYRCFIKTEEEGIEVRNTFTVGTLALMKECNIKVGVSHHVGNRFFWREVTAVGNDYIDLSKDICSIDSDAPAPGDDIIGLGHRTDLERQAAIAMSSVDETSPSIIFYQGINDFSLEGKEVIEMKFDKSLERAVMHVYGDFYAGDREGNNYIKHSVENGVEVKGKVTITPGSKGWENLDGLQDGIKNAISKVQVGAENLLRNTGFTGDYLPRKMGELTSKTELYSDKLVHWDGNAQVIADASSVSGFAAVVTSLTQNVALIQNEIYTLSFKAKGAKLKASLSAEEKIIELTNEYKRYQFQFTGVDAAKIGFAGNATVCEIKLERGTIATDWCPSRLDRNPVADEFRKFWTLMDALTGTTSIDGGLILTSVIRLGQWQDGQLKKVNGCMSGIYNDDNDVAYCAGGDLDKAIYTVMLYRDDPMYQPTEDELKNIANVVITHGGRAILNDVILRGYVYAEGGIFRGTVYATDGEFTGIVNANGGTFNGTVNATDGVFNGTVNATDGVFNGTVNATDGVFNGTVILGNGITKLSKNGDVYFGKIGESAPYLSITSTGAVFKGTITATSGTLDNIIVSSLSSKNGNFAIDEEGNASVKDIVATGGTFTQGTFEYITLKKNINTAKDNLFIDAAGNVKLKDVVSEGGTFDRITATNADITGVVHATGGEFKNVLIDGIYVTPWTVLEYKLISSSAEIDIWGYDGSVIHSDRLLLEPTAFPYPELKLPWGNDADGRNVFIRTQSSGAKVKIPSGKCIYIAAGKVVDNLTLFENHLYRFIGFKDYWIAENLIEIKNIEVTTNEANI